MQDATDKLWKLHVLQDKMSGPGARDFTGMMNDSSEESAQVLSHFIR